MLFLENKKLKKQIDDLMKINSGILNEDIMIEDISPILITYLVVTHDNIYKLPQGRRYDVLHEFYTLLSMMESSLLQYFKFQSNVSNI